MPLVKGGLHSFLVEVDRYTKTLGFHYQVARENGKIIIKHHCDDWTVTITHGEIVVDSATDELQLRTQSKTMVLNGKEVSKIKIPSGHTFNYDDIVNKILHSLSTWVLVKDYGLDWLVPSTH